MKNTIEYAKKLQEEYSYQPKEKNNFEKLKELDNKVKKPARIFSYIFGTIGSLVLGTGMCIAMGVIGGAMPVGIAIGLAGIGIVSATYPLHNKIIKARKNKYSAEILKLTNEVIEVSEYSPEKATSKQQVNTYMSDKSSSNYKDNSLER